MRIHCANALVVLRSCAVPHLRRNIAGGEWGSASKANATHWYKSEEGAAAYTMQTQ